MESTLFTIRLGKCIEHTKLQHQFLYRSDTLLSMQIPRDSASSGASYSRQTHPALSDTSRVTNLTPLGSNPSVLHPVGHHDGNEGNIELAVVPKATPTTTVSDNRSMLMKPSEASISRGTGLQSFIRTQLNVTEIDVSPRVQSKLDGAWSDMFAPLCLIILGAVAAWSAYGFDMIGDVYGIEAGITALAVSVVLIPFAVFVIFGLVNLFLGHSSSYLASIWSNIDCDIATSLTMDARSSGRTAQIQSATFGVSPVSSSFVSPLTRSDYMQADL
jgi:hypothetical protein